MGDDYIDANEQAGPNRREFIRRGALLLGVGAWAAPLVQVVRQQGHRGGGDGTSAPEVIGVQQVVAECTTCPTECGPVPVCGTAGVLECVCVPSPDPYPMAACICAVAVFCDEAQPCTTAEDCPEGQPCLQGCCPFTICLPPCEEPAPIVGPESQGLQASGASEFERTQASGTSKRATYSSAG